MHASGPLKPFSRTSSVRSKRNKQEAELPQRDRATRYFSKLVLRFTICGSYEDFKQQKRHSWSFKGIDNGAI